VTLFAAALLGLEIVLAQLERRAGSHLEGRLRMAFLEKLPRLADSYFQSRPISDMLERSHNTHVLRTLPQLGVRTLRVTAELVVTTAAICWLNPRMAHRVAAAGLPPASRCSETCSRSTSATRSAPTPERWPVSISRPAGSNGNRGPRGRIDHRT
jgi:hypothetical protein